MILLEMAIARLSSLGTGLLLGTALGVIIPEYVVEVALSFARLNQLCAAGVSKLLP